jgi:Zn-dependent protease
VESAFGPDFVVLGVAWYVVLLFSLTVHEAAHAFVALRGGDRTAYRGGQVSLDPLPHIRREPLGMVVFPIFAYALSGGRWMFGWASTPFDPAWARNYPRRAAWMSLAGPAANLLLALAAGMALRAGLQLGVFSPEPTSFAHLVGAPQGGVASAAGTILSILFTLNLVLFVFNLFPIPPLDGAGALGLLLPEDAARRLQEWFSSPGLALAGLLAVWWLFPRVFAPIHGVALSFLYAGVAGGAPS